MRWTGRLVAILLVLVPATVVVSGGSASGSEASRSAPIVLALTFRPVVPFANGNCGGPVWTSGRYALVSISSPTPYACATSFMLIDDKTGKEKAIRESGVEEVQAFGAPWILFLENGHYALYNIATKKTHSCRVSPCVSAPDGDALGYALGSRWLDAFIQQPGPCGDGVHNGCGPITESFYNIKTGRLRYTPSSSSTTIADLDSPRLFHRVCPPLQGPACPLRGLRVRHNPVHAAGLLRQLRRRDRYEPELASGTVWLEPPDADRYDLPRRTGVPACREHARGGVAGDRFDRRVASTVGWRPDPKPTPVHRHRPVKPHLSARAYRLPRIRPRHGWRPLGCHDSTLTAHPHRLPQ